MSLTHNELSKSYWRIRWNYAQYRGVYDLEPTHFIQDFFEGRISDDPLRLTFDPGDPRCNGDFPTYMPGLFLASHRAEQALSAILDETCIRYAADVGGEKYGLYVCTKVLTGFDYNRSVYNLYKNSTEVMNVRKAILQEGFATSFHVFRLQGEPAISYGAFVSNIFKARYEAANLEGLLFHPAQ